jgi:hypothetical protein
MMKLNNLCQQFASPLAFSQAADASTTAPSSLPLIHDAVTELARLHWPFFPGVRAVITAAAQRAALHDSIRQLFVRMDALLQ